MMLKGPFNINPGHFLFGDVDGLQVDERHVGNVEGLAMVYAILPQVLPE